jgi:hypothetical protein
MPFDPTKPATNSLIASAELRDQFNGLKTLIDENIPAAEKGAADGVASLDSNGLLVEQVDWSQVVNAPAFVLASGIAGGQTIVGGTGANENLTLVSTSHATQGNLVLANATTTLTANGDLTLTNAGNTASLKLDPTAGNGPSISANGVERIRVSQGTLLTSGGLQSVDFQNRLLRMSSSQTCLDWANGILRTNDNHTGIQWKAQTATAGHVPFSCQGAAGQTANLFQCVDSANNVKFAIEADGDIRTSQASPATTPGSVTAKLPIYDASGTLLGFLPIYDSIG